VSTARLPRSLDPLPQETLPGYVLRLAHRLERTPGRIASLTGLASQPGSGGSHQLPAGAMLALDVGQASQFAEAAGLTPDEVANLCLCRFSHRYAPLRGAGTTSRPQPRGLARTSRYWVLTDATRYCPECLAGDGSAIQAAHGGGWSQLWRLPMVTACIRHQRLLSYYCPRCGQPAHLSRLGALLPRMGDPGLHPGQCRATVRVPGKRSGSAACAARLDVPGASDTGIGQELLGQILTQQRLLICSLDAGGGVPETHAIGITGDLIALAVLIKMSWPKGEHLVAPCLRPAVAAHVERTRLAVPQLRGSADATLWLMRRPPGDPAACAALMLAADEIRSMDWRALRDAAAPMIGHLRHHEPRALYIIHGRDHCTPGLRAALAFRRGSYWTASRAQPRRAPAARRQACAGDIPRVLHDADLAGRRTSADGLPPQPGPVSPVSGTLGEPRRL
jgi:TniQ